MHRDYGGVVPELASRDHVRRVLPLVQRVLAQADQALYHAKERGRNRVELASLDLVLRLDSNTPSLRIDALAADRAA